MGPSPTSTNLLAAYGRWKALQDQPTGHTPGERAMTRRVAKVGADVTARQVAAVAKAGQIEAKAFRKSVKKVAQASTGGADPTAAILHGYKAYRKRGGSASLEAWRRRVANG